MSYSVRLIIGREVNINRRGGKWHAWFDAEAMIEIGFWVDDGALDLLPWTEGNQGIEVYIYGSDGDTRIYHDEYEAPLRPLPAGRVMVALLQDIKDHGKEWIQVRWALALLEAMVEDWEDLQVVKFGH